MVPILALLLGLQIASGHLPICNPRQASHSVFGQPLTELPITGDKIGDVSVFFDQTKGTVSDSTLATYQTVNEFCATPCMLQCMFDPSSYQDARSECHHTPEPEHCARIFQFLQTPTHLPTTDFERCIVDDKTYSHRSPQRWKWPLVVHEFSRHSWTNKELRQQATTNEMLRCTRECKKIVGTHCAPHINSLIAQQHEHARASAAKDEQRAKGLKQIKAVQTEKIGAFHKLTKAAETNNKQSQDNIHKASDNMNSTIQQTGKDAAVVMQIIAQRQEQSNDLQSFGEQIAAKYKEIHLLQKEYSQKQQRQAQQLQGEFDTHLKHIVSEVDSYLQHENEKLAEQSHATITNVLNTVVRHCLDEPVELVTVSTIQ